MWGPMKDSGITPNNLTLAPPQLVWAGWAACCATRRRGSLLTTSACLDRLPCSLFLSLSLSLLCPQCHGTKHKGVSVRQRAYCHLQACDRISAIQQSLLKCVGIESKQLTTRGCGASHVGNETETKALCQPRAVCACPRILSGCAYSTI